MSKVKILWSGITGRTGREAIELSKDNEDAKIVAGICRSDSRFYNYDEMDNIKEDFDVIVDFSHKDSFDKVLEYAIRMNKPIIIGTAGLTDEQMKAFEDASYIIPVFRGGNFRFEVKKFIDDVVKYAKTCSEDTIELVETHYKTVPVPSQTAQTISKKVFKETGKKVEIKSFIQDEEETNDWRVNHLRYKCPAYDEELAKDILNIAIMMKEKKADGVYDLDRLFSEKDLDDLYNFLIEAKKQTYANENGKKSASSRKGSYDYEYSSNGMTYHDTYFGSTSFMGEEVVYSSSDVPIWGMNYYGVTLDESLTEEAVDKALRPALMKVGEDAILPVRGPKEFVNGEYKYEFNVSGDLSYFEGEESIYKNNKKVYSLKCCGGLIKK